MTKTLQFDVPFPCQPKQRPRLGKERVFNNAGYTKWKSAVRLVALRAATKAGWPLSTTEPISMGIEVYKDHFRVSLSIYDNKTRHGRADLDNLFGGVADALQPGRRNGKSVGVGLFSDDRQIVWMTAGFV